MDEPKPKKITDEKVAFAKASHYCAYQERSQQEVRDKLYEWGLWPQAVENIITWLIRDNFLNEERFANAYAQGKFHQKGWGKIKIKQGLQFKRVSDVLIKKSLQNIDPDEYLTTLRHVLEKKASQLSGKPSFKRNYQLLQYGLIRGYERDLVTAVLNSLGD